MLAGKFLEKYSGVEFTKMHGNGNDFVVFDEFEEVVVPEEEKSFFVKAVCDRRFGIGGDGVIFIQKSEVADARFRYFNSDGSEAEMCGNGIRCFARLAFERGYVKEKFRAETLAGIKELEVSGNAVRVDMGNVLFSPEKIPAKGGNFDGVWRVEMEGWNVYAANTGVPHAVVFLDCEELERLDMEIAKKIRYSDAFPEGVNVNFACVSGEKIRVRTYERGVEGETLSCGTGSVGVAAIAYKLGLSSRNVKVVTRGGELLIELVEDEKGGEMRAYMTGKAVKVFEGRLLELELR